MNKSLLFGPMFGLCLTGLCMLSCSQDDDSFTTANSQTAFAPASQKVAVLNQSFGVDTLIAQIVSDPDIQAKVVSITCDNLTGEIDMVFDPSYITEEQSQALQAPANGWKFGGHVNNEWDAYKMYRRLEKTVGSAKRVFFMVVKSAKGGWDVYYKTANK